MPTHQLQFKSYVVYKKKKQSLNHKNKMNNSFLAKFKTL